MIPFKVNQIVRFHTPLPHEDPDQLFLLLELAEDVQPQRAAVRSISFNGSFAPINTVPLEDLEAVSMKTAEMFNHSVSVLKDDGTIVHGTVIGSKQADIFLELKTAEYGIVSNCLLEISDAEGTVHEGFYIVRK